MHFPGRSLERRHGASEIHWELADPEIGRHRLSLRFGGHDFSHLELDRKLTPADFPDPSGVEAARSRTEVIVGFVRQKRPTLRQLLAKLAGARGHFIHTLRQPRRKFPVAVHLVAATILLI